MVHGYVSLSTVCLDCCLCKPVELGELKSIYRRGEVFWKGMYNAYEVSTALRCKVHQTEATSSHCKCLYAKCKLIRLQSDHVFGEKSPRVVHLRISSIKQGISLRAYPSHYCRFPCSVLLSSALRTVVCKASTKTIVSYMP